MQESSTDVTSFSAVNEVPLDDRMETYLKTTETSNELSDSENAGRQIGTLSLLGSDFEEPLMYSSNLMYYTEHNSKNAKSGKGAIFMDSRIEDFESSILVIHGLTTKDADMFTILASYTDAAWATENDTLELDITESFKKTYKLFSVIETDNSDAVIYLNCETDLAYRSFFDSLIEKSCIETNAEFNAEKQMVILNTALQDGTHYVVCFMETDSSDN